MFRADRPAGESAGASQALDHSAELIAHAGAETPLTIGLFGGAGSGKSHAVERLAARTQALSAAAAALGAGPFVLRLVIARISAADVADDPATGIAGAIYTALSAPGSGRSFAALARTATQASTDPHAVARDANRQLDETRHHLDSDRRKLDELGARRARLGETLLYESAGSRVDSYVRDKRSTIESRLRGFGFTGEPIASYKDLVRDAADHPGLIGRTRAFLRALWAFEGQSRLVIWAILLFLLAWGSGVARETNAAWLPWLRGLSEQAAPVADWIAAHLDWFDVLRKASIALACLCLAANIWRAVRFVAPLFRGAHLLRLDLETRRRDLDAQLAHQTRRVDALASESDALARHAAEAEQRATEKAQSGALASSNPFLTEADAGARSARAFMDSLEASMMQGASVEAPQRILVIIDELEALAPARAAQFIETAQRLLARRGFVTLMCVDVAHLADGWAGASVTAQRLQRMVQIPLNIALPGGEEALQSFARGLLGNASQSQTTPKLDASRSALDQPIAGDEADFIATLAPLAGDSPRGVKRFINIYRLARARGGDLPSLALMLALDSGGSKGELAAMGAAMDVEGAAGALMVHPGEPRLGAALAAVNKVRGQPLSIAQAQAAWLVASEYRAPL